MPWDDNLSGPARLIAKSKRARLRVRAGPGTGKTFALMRRVARLLEEGTPHSEILVSTFTRTAAADLKQELKVLNAPNAEDVKAATIHSLCFSILSRSAVLEITGRVPRPLFDFELRFLLEDLRDPSFGTIHQKRKLVKGYEAAWARLQTETPGQPIDPVDVRFRREVQAWLRFHRAMIIGELVPEVYSYLNSNPAADELSRFSHILVDEYQDLNVAEQRVIDLLARNAHLTVIGDANQSIYSFKYAHPEGIETFGNRHGDTKDRSLDECWRCPTRIVRMANSLIQWNDSHVSQPLHEKTENPSGEVLVVQWASLEDEASGLARYVRHQISNNGTQPGQVLVLAPARIVGHPIRDALRDIGVAAQSFFQEEALRGDPKKRGKCRCQQAFTLLTLLADPSDEVGLRCWCGFESQNLQWPAWKRIRARCEATGLSLPEVLDEIRAGQFEPQRSRTVRKRLRELNHELQKLNGLTGQALVDALFPENEEALAQLREYAASSTRSSDRAEQVLAALRSEITQPELPKDVDYVRVMSLYKSKGLTADVVVVAGCVEGLTPRIAQEGSKSELKSSLEEQRRLFYVATTRARRTLVISSFSSIADSKAHKLLLRGRRRGRDFRTLASRFIEELGNNCPSAVLGKKLLKSRGIAK